MSEVVEIQTGTDLSEVVEQLAKTMGDETLCLPVPESVEEGEWVRFTIRLEDGTHVIEGVGRCAGAVPRGNPTDRYDLHLSDLSFDERNEIMYERMLIAKDAAKEGDETGTIKLEDEAMEAVEGEDEVTESSPPARSVPPPPPATPPAAVGRADAVKKSPSSAEPKPGATPPKKVLSTPPLASPRAAAVAKVAQAPEGDTTKVDLEAPKKDRPASVRPSRRPPAAAISDGPYTLEVPFELVSQARRLEDRLPRKLFDRDRKPKKPEAAVLLTAIRVGLGALDAAADD